MSQAYYVILGLLMLTGLNYGGTLAFLSFYFWVARTPQPLKETALMGLSLSLANALVQFLCMVIFLSAGPIVYPSATLLFALTTYFCIMHFYYKIHHFENAIITISLSVVMNPVWLILFGIIR